MLKVYLKQTVRRYDGQDGVRYFTHRDFDGLMRRDICFPSEQGNMLRGGLYYYGGYDESKLVVFCHGIGYGHLSYLNEIETLARSGFQVLAYDNTGCAESKGENIRGMSQSLPDLLACIKYIEKDGELNKKELSVVGHSWGGYAAGNIGNFTDRVKKVVVISGFCSVKLLLKQFLPGPLALFRGGICRYEKSVNPDYFYSSSLTGLVGEGRKALVIHSDDDNVLSIRYGLGYLSRRLKSPNVTYLTVTGKKHNPNYTADAVNYLNETFAAFNKGVKEKTLKTPEEQRAFFKDVDWLRMTEQDGELFEKIVDFLKKQ